MVRVTEVLVDLSDKAPEDWLREEAENQQLNEQEDDNGTFEGSNK